MDCGALAHNLPVPSCSATEIHCAAVSGICSTYSCFSSATSSASHGCLVFRGGGVLRWRGLSRHPEADIDKKRRALQVLPGVTLTALMG